MTWSLGDLHERVRALEEAVRRIWARLPVWQ